ncbi:hypothetical protein D5S18_00775 [Nocardia panacis]|uniref:ESX-1 secretion-associated protein n=1 Tax=Nocardia panacis TaxID=2340916 RepID=A0A3A4KWN4_9NOCA|nr:WXG100 family type VII secretion target [Nocardia panacis]RJO79841.1 hypothetical protein D5S18_00775 [Nocardia panacis]
MAFSVSLPVLQHTAHETSECSRQLESFMVRLDSSQGDLHAAASSGATSAKAQQVLTAVRELGGKLATTLDSLHQDLINAGRTYHNADVDANAEMDSVAPAASSVVDLSFS